MSDVAVVGAGIVGLATAFALVERGATVTVYERGVPGAGQSGGESRIFRHAHDDPRLIAFARESRALWRTWEERFGVELLAPVGSVAVGPAVERRLELLRHAGVRARPVDAAEALPILAPRAEPAMLDEDGGVIRTRATVAALVGALGDALVADEVIEVLPSGEVRAGGAVARHERVVVCAGRDTATLAAGAGLELPGADRHAHALRLSRARPRAAGLPPGRQRSRLRRPAARQRPLRSRPRKRRGTHRAYVAEALPGLEPRPVEARTCWVTGLPWGHDGLAVWEAGALRFVAGNNLFKHAPALGRRIAADALGELRPKRGSAGERRLRRPGGSAKRGR